MNGWDIFLILLIGAAFLLALRKVRKDMKSGNGCLSCGGNCAGCSGCSKAGKPALTGRNVAVISEADKTNGAAGCVSEI